MQLTKDECQYILNAIDTHVRSKGINAAGPGVVIAQKMQTEFSVPTEPIDAPDAAPDED